MPYPRVNVMRYMGNKSRLLDFIVPRLEELAKPGETVLDLMSGTCSVAYALKQRNRLLVNDIQAYAQVIGMALIENSNVQINSCEAIKELAGHIAANERSGVFTFFTRHYADTYFSPAQCRDIDNIRYAAEQVADPYRKALYLTALLFAMCYAQSTTGHFAQYLPGGHARLRRLRRIDLKEAFFGKCDGLPVHPSPFANRALRLEAEHCVAAARDEGVRLVYLDPPYSPAQYSRFYHLLETAVLYDSPRLSHKGLYRSARHLSAFCYPGRAAAAFSSLIAQIRCVLDADLVVSYCDRGVVPLNQLLDICRAQYRYVEGEHYAHLHSTQGKGTNSVREVLLCCRRQITI